MFEFLFDTPVAIAAPAIILAMCAFGLAGLLLVRRHLLPPIVPMLQCGLFRSNFSLDIVSFLLSQIPIKRIFL